MTIAQNFRTEVRPYSGYNDPSLPIGAWIGQGVLIGNATGGFLQMNLLFQFGQQELVSELYNVEQFTADVSANTTQVAEIQTRNMDRLAGDRLVGVQRWQFPVIGDGVNNAMSQLESQAGLPIFLGRPTTRLLECGVRVQFANTDLLTFSCTLQGYIWGPRSVLAEGGPRRPVNGLFRA